MNINRYLIQVGDKVTYEFKGNIYTIVITENGTVITEDAKILKIERPTYEVVAEVKKKKEELLTEYERVYLRNLLDSDLLKDKNIIKVYVDKMVTFDDIEYVHVEFRSEDRTEMSITNYFHRFKGLDDCENYTLEELGLEEINE